MKLSYYNLNTDFIKVSDNNDGYSLKLPLKVGDTIYGFTYKTDNYGFPRVHISEIVIVDMKIVKTINSLSIFELSYFINRKEENVGYPRYASTIAFINNTEEFAKYAKNNEAIFFTTKEEAEEFLKTDEGQKYVAKNSMQSSSRSVHEAMNNLHNLFMKGRLPSEAFIKEKYAPIVHKAYQLYCNNLELTGVVSIESEILQVILNVSGKIANINKDILCYESNLNDICPSENTLSNLIIQISTKPTYISDSIIKVEDHIKVYNKYARSHKIPEFDRTKNPIYLRYSEAIKNLDEIIDQKVKEVSSKYSDPKYSEV